MNGEIPDLGGIYAEAVARRGGHEYTGGPVEWEPSGPYVCPGCPLCAAPAATAARPARAGGRR